MGQDAQTATSCWLPLARKASPPRTIHSSCTASSIMEQWPDETVDYGEAKPRVKVTGEFVLSYHAKRQLAAWTCSDNSSHCVCHATVVQSSVFHVLEQLWAVCY